MRIHTETIIAVAIAWSAGGSLGDSFITQFFPGVQLGMSTNELLAARPNAYTPYPTLGRTVLGLGEVVQSNCYFSAYVYCFATNGIGALLRTSLTTANGLVVRDVTFDAQVRTALSNDFTQVGQQNVRRLRHGVQTNDAVTVWAESGTSNRVVFLSASNEATVVYFAPTVFGVTNFFLLSP